MKKQIAFWALLQLLLSCIVIAQNVPNDWKAVEQAFGRSGQQQADGAYKFGLGRAVICT